MSTDPLDNHVLLTNQQGYQDNSGDLGKQDVARAKQLLDQAGWTSTDGGKTRTKNGKTLNLRFVITSTNDTYKQVAEIVQSQLAAVGVQITIVPVPGSDYYTKYVNTGDFDIAPVTFGGNAYPISTAQPEFANPTTGSDGTLNIQQNYGRIGDPEIDNLFTQALSTMDRDPDDRVREPGGRGDLEAGHDRAAVSAPADRGDELQAGELRCAGGAGHGLREPGVRERELISEVVLLPVVRTGGTTHALNGRSCKRVAGFGWRPASCWLLMIPSAGDEHILLSHPVRRLAHVHDIEAAVAQSRLQLLAFAETQGRFGGQTAPSGNR